MARTMVIARNFVTVGGVMDCRTPGELRGATLGPLGYLLCPRLEN